MLGTLVSSKTRVKLLIKFFLCEEINGYLRSMEREFDESTNSIRMELQKFIKAGLLISEQKGNIKYYKANSAHPLYEDIRHIVHKSLGIDQILEHAASGIENLESIVIIGSYANGIESDIIELVFVGHDLDARGINKRIELIEKSINRKVMHLLYTPSQMEYFFHNKPHFILWKAETPSAFKN